MSQFQPKWWLVATLAVGIPLPALALGDLMVTPTRVVLEGRQTSSVINIVNTGNAAATYRILLINQRMTEDGRFEEIKTLGPGEQTAEDLIRYTPRQVILPPGGSQVIRVQRMRNRKVGEGEYRSHLLFRSIPNLETEQSSSSTEISVKLIPVYGLSIPLIVREGNPFSTLNLSDLRVENKKVSVHINRTGNRSVYGNLSFDFTPPSGVRKVINQVKGLAVYTPNTTRVFSFPLSDTLSHGRLKATFKEEVEGKDPIQGETQLELP